MTNRNPEKLLLVEGHDDQHLVLHFCEKKLGDKLICAFRNKQKVRDNDNDKPVFYMRQGGGCDGIITTISIINQEIKSSNLERLGIVLDADDPPNGTLNSPGSNWQKLKAKLEEFLILENYDLPECPPQERLILPCVTPKEPLKKSPLQALMS